MIKTLLALVLTVLPAWDHPGYDAENSYYNPHESAINADSINHLTRTWSVRLRGTQPACAAPSAPLIADGRVFVTDAMGISAYQASDGRRLWHFTWEAPDDSSTPVLALSGSLLIAANNDCHSNSDPDGLLTAVNVATGKPAWHVATDTPVFTLAVDKGAAVISGSSPSDELTTLAFRAADGKPLWNKPLFSSSGVSANGRLLLTQANTTSAADITTGAVRWTHPTAWTAQAATPGGNHFVATAGTTLAFLSATNGTVTWSAPGKASTLIATDGRRIYRGDDRTIEALDSRNGHVAWSRELPAEATQPLRAGELIYTGGPILNAATGTVTSPATAYPGHQLAVGGHLYTVTDTTLSSYAP
ncbi:PQQ-binding-like beta-propeller repeat protein [Actinoplanes sp. NPDC051343]|uniref:outer membrane protein assembly factor BamB family protein n=1 Tax=Actinoplanes sp. NPDC051343 TaxID=3363906 RepID=UPI003787C6CA